MDGIICEEPRVPDADGGPGLARYRQWLMNAKPFHLTRAQPIKLIVTGRLEQFRKETEDWLSKHGVKFDKLVMCPAQKASQRGDIAAMKAEAYKNSTTAFFVESDPKQAERIFQIAKKQVICPSISKVWR